MYMKTIKICTQCSISFSIYRSHSRYTIRPFCSFKCYGLWQRNKTKAEQGKKVKPSKLCSFEKCKTIHFGKGYCKHHYWKFIERFKSKFFSRSDKDESIVFYCKRCNAHIKRKSYNNIIPKFCSTLCFGLFYRKPYISKKGYRKLLILDHPRADKKGYVFEHIVVMERYLGRSIISPEVIHHIDHNRGNNDIKNLMLFPDHSSHMAYHKKENQLGRLSK